MGQQESAIFSFQKSPKESKQKIQKCQITPEQAQFFALKSSLSSIKHRKVCQKMYTKYLYKQNLTICMKNTNENIDQITKQKIIQNPFPHYLTITYDFALLNNNQINQITDSMQHLTNIKQLELDFNLNYLKQQGTTLFNKGFSYLKNLKSLSLLLYDNEIMDQGVQNLAKGLKKLVNLESLSLNLGLNQIGIQGVSDLSQSLKKLKKLKTLSILLIKNYIDNKGVQYLSDSIQQLPQIKNLTLLLQDNNITDQAGEYLANIQNSHSVEILTIELKNTQIGNQFLKNFSQNYLQNQKLTHFKLGISKNNISSECYMYLPLLSQKMKNIQSLEIDLEMNTDFGVQGGQYLGQALQNLTRLETLSLNLNSVSLEDEGLELLCKGIQKNRNLGSITLELKKNNLRCNSILYLSQTFQKLEQIEDINLDLSQNSIGPDGPQHLQERIVYLKNLKEFHLDLEQNKLGTGIQNLKSLKFYLYKKQIIHQLYYW